MRTLSSPAARKTPVRHISQMGGDIRGPATPSAGFARPTMSGDMDTARMFELFENKAEVEILNSPADDQLAASMYGVSGRLGFTHKPNVAKLILPSP